MVKATKITRQLESKQNLINLMVKVESVKLNNKIQYLKFVN